MTKGSLIAMAARYYLCATAGIADILGAYYKVAFPDQYQRYCQAFEAGIWHIEDPGPWLGRAIVYKLQVYPHQDKLDGGPAAIFNVGQYEGGHLYLTDLKMKLA